MSGTAILNNEVEDVLSKPDAKQFDMQQVLTWVGAATTRRRLSTDADMTCQRGTDVMPLLSSSLSPHFGCIYTRVRLLSCCFITVG
jgi:hypothetical protein